MYAVCPGWEACPVCHTVLESESTALEVCKESEDRDDERVALE